MALKRIKSQVRKVFGTDKTKNSPSRKYASGELRSLRRAAGGKMARQILKSKSVKGDSRLKY